jgi:hypothetical protein
MIPDDAQIAEVRRIYTDDYGGNCYDFAPRSCFFVVANEESDGGDYSDEEPIYSRCNPVLLTYETVGQFSNACWQPVAASLFWIAVEDCIPVDEDTDARIRAMSALLGELPVLVREF